MVRGESDKRQWVSIGVIDGNPWVCGLRIFISNGTYSRHEGWHAAAECVIQYCRNLGDSVK